MSDAPPDRAGFAAGALRVAPNAVESTLAELWHPAAEAAEPGVVAPLVTRVSLGTHIVVAPAELAAGLEASWAEVALRHPCRVILARLAPGDAPLAAAVAAACHLPEPGAPQVCSERILLSLGADHAARLPGAVLPLLEPDVPAVLWWHLPTAPEPAIAEQLGRQVERIVLELSDSAAPAATLAAFGGGPPLADLAWSRAGWWREAVARLFDGQSEALEPLETIAVTGAAQREGHRFPAALLAGWAARQLGWRPVVRESVDLTQWLRPNGLVGRVRLSQVPVGDGRPGRLQAILLEAPADHAWYRLERLGDRPRELRAEAHQAHRCAVPTIAPAPRPEPVEVLLAAVSAARRNPVRDESLAYAAWILGWQEG